MAQVDYFLKIEGVEGESTDDKHKKELDVESFSWGETNSGTAGHGSGSGAGKVHPQDFTFTKRMDKSSPVLFIGCALGTHYKEATFTADEMHAALESVRKADEDLDSKERVARRLEGLSQRPCQIKLEKVAEQTYKFAYIA